MDIEKLVDSILTDQITVNDLDTQQMEAVIDFMREYIGTIEDEDVSDTLLEMVDAIEMAAENRFANQSSGAWDEIIEASVARGNSYFEMEQYCLQ